MGDASGGRSATSPTFFKSTSVRTRIEWQNSQVVWTALDQRNVTGAPQLGQFAVGALMVNKADRTCEPKRRMPRTLVEAELRNRYRDAAGSRTDSGTAIRIRETCGRSGATPKAA